MQRIGKPIACDRLRSDGTGWQRLFASLDVEHNEAAAQVRGPGLYVLMASHSKVMLPLMRVR